MAAFFDAAGARAGAGAAAGHDTHQANPLCRSSIPTSDSTSSSSSRRHPPCILAAIMLLLLALPACCRGSGLARPAFLRPHLVSASSCLAVARGVHPQQQQQQQRPGPAPCIAARVFSSSPAGAVEGGGGGGAEGIAAAVERDLSPSPASVVSAPALKLKRRQRRTVTGGLKNLPIALPAVELLNRALRVAKYIKVSEASTWGGRNFGHSSWIAAWTWLHFDPFLSPSLSHTLARTPTSSSHRSTRRR